MGCKTFYSAKEGIFMNSCKAFSKKHPILLVVLSFAFMYGLLKLTSLVPNGLLSFGIMEIIRAIVVFTVTFLLMGKEKVSFSTKGFSYAFLFFRRYLILMTVVAILTPVFSVPQLIGRV